MRARNRFGRWLFPLLLSAFVLPPEAVADSGTCYVATIREPFAIEQGGVHPAGRLRICESARLSPVESLHVIYVDGSPEGAFRFRAARASDRKLAEGAAVFLFAREGDGVLWLEGYGYRRGTEERMLERVSTRRKPSPGVVRATDLEPVVLVAMQDR